MDKGRERGRERDRGEEDREGRGDRGRRRGTGEGGRESRVKKDCGNAKEKGNGMGISPHGHF